MSNTAHLIQQLLGNTDEVININDLRYAAAKELERLTQPVGEVEPVAEVHPGYKLVWRAPDWGLSTPAGTLLYSAATVTSLIAERDAAIHQQVVNHEHGKIWLEIANKRGDRLKTLEVERDEADRRAGCAERERDALQEQANVLVAAYARDIEKGVIESVKAGIGEHSPEAAISLLAHQRDALQEQANVLRKAGLAIKARLDRNGMSGRQLPEYPLLEEALAATEPKETPNEN